MPLADLRLVNAHMTATYARKERLGNYLFGLGNVFGWGSDAFLEGAVDGVLAAQTEQALSAWNVHATAAELADPLGRTLEADAPLEVIVGAASHDGTPLETVYRRPGMLAAELALEGLTTQAIDARVGRQIYEMADADISVAGRTAEQVHAKVDLRCVGVRRVPNGGACDWCQYIATQRYTVEDLAPAHNHCGCGTREIYGKQDPGSILNEKELARIKREGVPKRYGQRKKDAAAANRKSALGKPFPKNQPKLSAPRPDLGDVTVPDPAVVNLRPAPGTAKGVDSLEWQNAKVEAEFRPFIDALDELHGTAPDGYGDVLVRTGATKTTSKGGHFAPRGKKARRPARKKGEDYLDWRVRYQEAIEKAKRPEILVNDRGDGTRYLSFLHEYGHRVDWEDGASRFATGTSRHSDEVKDALAGFLRAATENPHFAEARVTALRGGTGFRSYWVDPVEVWARAYSQWAAERIGGAAKESLEAMLEKSEWYQWPTELFNAEIAPAVEELLRARGLLE